MNPAASKTPGEDVDDRIVTAWLNDAVAEHASIASFARFTLELLSLGAPPKLVIASQDAGRDEVQHAQKCFAIASRLGGRKLGPGPLDLGGLDGPRGLTAITAATVKEGCIVETLSAALASARAAGAGDGQIRAALAKIAEDETRHAELAWRFLEWALERGGESLREAVARTFEEESRARPTYFQRVLAGVPADLVRHFGHLEEAVVREVTARTYAETIGPRARRLLERCA